MRIKCPHCNGKGFSEINSALNMTCGWCMGQGELDLEIVPTEPQTEAEIEKKWENTVWDTDVYLDALDWKEPLTEQEYIQTCSTEQLADVLGKIAKNAYQCGQDGKTNKCVNCKNCTGYCDYGWEVWLKQPHQGE